VGDADDVVERLGVKHLKASGLTGKGVRVAVVDTGIDGQKVRVSKTDGWGPSKV
jgi:subtilisin family serine protease